MTSRSPLTCIVPTAGRSSLLLECIQALQSNQPDAVLVVAEEGIDVTILNGMQHLQSVTVPPGAGFARACNQGLKAADSEYVALVNDDAVVSPVWCEDLISILREDHQIAAAQGTILRLDDESRIDGCGIGWNRHWQAIQVDRGAPPDFAAPIRDVFGVSGTAAIFRRSTLNEVALPGQQYFDANLGTYYEDVELACRLRSCDFRTVHVPGARVRHSGGASSAGDQRWRWSQIYGNRLLVLARLWGRSFAPRLPALWLRDAADLTAAAVRGDRSRLAGIVSGWSRAALRLGQFAHLGASMLSTTELNRFRNRAK